MRLPSLLAEFLVVVLAAFAIMSGVVVMVVVVDVVNYVMNTVPFAVVAIGISLFILVGYVLHCFNREGF